MTSDVRIDGEQVSVWYAAYGASLLKAYFVSRYLQKCPAGTLIKSDRPFQLEFKLYFAREVKRLGGAVAFVRTHREGMASTLGRAYLLTLTQFICVAREQNAGLDVNIAADMLFGSPTVITKEKEKGWHNILLPYGTIDTTPVVTLTGPEVPSRPPSKAHLDAIRRVYTRSIQPCQIRRSKNIF